VAALVVGSGYAIVKVMKLKDEHTGLSIYVSQEFENHRKELEKRETQIYHNMDIRSENHRKELDSRCDKLYEKIMKDADPKKRILQMISKSPAGMKVDPEE
jgi:uncharacterized phage-like protein YoqJ